MQLFRELTRLLEKYLIIRAEDGEGEDTQQAQEQQAQLLEQEQQQAQLLEQQQGQLLDQEQHSHLLTPEQQAQLEQDHAQLLVQQEQQSQLEQEHAQLLAQQEQQAQLDQVLGQQMHYATADGSELQSYQLKSDEAFEQHDMQQVSSAEQQEESMQQCDGEAAAAHVDDGMGQVDADGGEYGLQAVDSVGQNGELLALTKVEHDAEESMEQLQ